MTNDILRVARCSCGALTAETRGEPEISAMCSCTACQRRTGSAFGISVYWPEAQVTIRGASTAWQRQSERGRHFEQHFCPICGTTLWSRGAFLPGRIGIAGGCFADPDFPVPTIAVWDKTRQRWLADLHDLSALPEQRC